MVVMKKMFKQATLPLVVATLASLPSAAQALDFHFYGSIRVHGEAVEPDNRDVLDSYLSWRDAYSRLGFKANHEFDNGLGVYGQLELPLDIPNKAVQDPWDQEEDIRIAKLGVKGAFGNLSVGQMWMPYYNAIAYPVDMFSSYYSGFATYTTFRKGDTLAYYSPTFAGFSAAAAFSQENGAAEADGDSDDRWQATLGYTFGEVTLAGGLDHLGGADQARIWGASLMWQASEALFLGAKYEMHDSDLDSGYGADGDVAMNLYIGYTLGKNTFKAMVADVDQYGEQIFHLGIDHQYRDDLKFFIEYYSEEESAAITTEYGGAAETCWDCSGGYVVAAGVRYDFALP